MPPVSVAGLAQRSKVEPAAEAVEGRFYGTVAAEPRAIPIDCLRFGRLPRPADPAAHRPAPGGSSVSTPVMRFTVVDADGAMSFVAPGHALKMLTAACSHHPANHRALLGFAEEYDPRLAGGILKALSRIDAERSDQTAPNDAVAPAQFGGGDGEDAAPFRVVDEATRRRSLEPARAGLVVFNLPAKRIVQIQNSYADLRRKDRGRLRRDGRPVRALYSYELPAEWSIVP